jgi:hypothetical protein
MKDADADQQRKSSGPIRKSTHDFVRSAWLDDAVLKSALSSFASVANTL